MDAVSFELFRLSCDSYFSLSNEKLLNVKIDKSADRKGNMVQYTYEVTPKDADSYTVNLYCTKCSLLINGKATRHFIETGFPEIHEQMLKITIEGIPINTR